MNIRKTIKMLIVGLVIMSFTSICMAFSSIGGGGLGSEGFGFRGFGEWGTYEIEETTTETAEKEETVTEEETVAEAEPETEPMEEDEYADDEVI